MLADAGGDVRLALGHFVKRLDHHLLEDDFVLLTLEMVFHVIAVGDFRRDAVGERRLLFPLGDLREPGGVLLLNRPFRDQLVQARQCILDVADDGQVRLAVFVQLRRVNIHMHNRAVLAKFLELAGHAVVEAHAEREQ